MNTPLLALSALLGGVICASSAQAGSAVSQAVKDACRGDYKAYCSQHEVGSQALRDCMSDAFDKLSEPCVSAIMDAEMERRQAQQDEAQPVKRKRQVAERKRKKHWTEHVKHGEQVAQRFMSRVAMKVNRYLH